MARDRQVILLLGLLLTGSVSAAPAPAPGPTRTLVLPQTTTVVAPVPAASGGTTPGAVSRTVPTTVPVPAPSLSQQTTPATSLTTPGTQNTPAQAPTVLTPPRSAPSTAPPRTAPASAPTTSTSTSFTPRSSPAQAPLSQGATSTAGGASATTTPGAGAALAPAPAVPPSSSGYYNVTVQANNATGALTQAQATELSAQIQQYLASRGGISTQVYIANQTVGSPTSSAGRRLHQQTFTLDLALVLGPISAAEAALCKQLLNGLQLNLGTTVIVVVVVVFVPVTVFVPVPSVINQPPNVPTLPPSTNITVPSGSSPPGTGGNIASQNVAGGGSITSQGVVNNINTVNNIVNNNNNTTNINNSVNNINSGNINNVNSGNSNNVVNTVINNVQNPTTPGAQAPATSTPGSSTPGTPSTTPAPATPGGASSGSADTTAVPPTYITQPAPTNSQPPAVPSPPPSPPPSCGSQPQCRIFSRDMLCCQNEGILTPYQGAQVEILCTHQVRFAITCLATSGPTNISAASVYNNDYGYNYNFRTNINWLGQTNGYLGKVSVDVQPARFAADRPECSLNLQTPCDLNGELVSTMPAVEPLSFNVIDFNSFYQNYVGYPPTNAIGQFSYSWMNNTYPGGCLEQPTLTVPGAFFVGAWPSQEGFAYPCNASATYGALQQTCPSVTTQVGSGVTGIAPN